MSNQTKYLLGEDRIPKTWYNIVADLPSPPPPVLHPGTGQPVGPEDLSPLFPMALIGQEVSGDRITAPYNAPAAGPAPWDLYRFVVRTAFGTATAELTPGTISKRIPASASASASSPPRPKTKGSPPLSRTTSLPSRA